MDSSLWSAAGWFVVLCLVLSGIVYTVVIYNNLVQLKHAVSTAWRNIDVLLKQRHDELPKLVDVCKEHAKFEKETLERVMLARAAAHDASKAHDVKGVGEAETVMRAGLSRLFAVAENYPELKTAESFTQLRRRVTEIEEQIADRREFYNHSVFLNNTRVEQFPDVVIAKYFAFSAADLLEFEEEKLTDVSIGEAFNVSAEPASV